MTQVLIDLNRIYTSQEFAQLPDDGKAYELINGKLIMTPPPGDDHGRIGTKLLKAILFFDPEEKLGQVWFTTGFELDESNTPAPDMAFVVASRVPPRSRGAVPVVPDLVVEVWSPSQLTTQGPDQESRDKIIMYQKVGVRIIWSVNPRNKTVEVYHPEQPAPVVTLGLDDELDGEAIIPGFKLSIKALFE
jgi:Uma2 family endonuclease